MNIRNQQSIRVYNYTPNKVCFATRSGRGYRFAACEDGVPSVEYMPWEDIEWLNGKSGVFRTGLLRFSPEEEQEIFEALGCPDYRDAMFTEERIREILLNPTPENVETIIGITSSSVLERIRGRMHKLISVGGNVSAKIESVVNARASELRNGKLKSAMSVKRREESDNANNKAIEELQAQLKAMQEQLAAKPESVATPAVEPAPVVEEATAPKKAPAAKKKSTSKKTSTKRKTSSSSKKSTSSDKK